MSEKDYFETRRNIKRGAGIDLSTVEIWLTNMGVFVGQISRLLSNGEKIERSVVFRDPAYLGRAFDFFDEEVRKAEISGKNPRDYTYHSLDGTSTDFSEIYDSERTSKFLHNEVERLEKREKKALTAG